MATSRRKFDDIFIRFDALHECDRWTDRRTPADSLVSRLRTASGGNESSFPLIPRDFCRSRRSSATFVLISAGIPHTRLPFPCESRAIRRIPIIDIILQLNQPIKQLEFGGALCFIWISKFNRIHYMPLTVRQHNSLRQP